MILGLKPYPVMKDSGVPWLGQVPEHWELRRLRHLAEMRVSSVDKHTKVDEEPIRLCNYVDVYKNDHIRNNMTFMRATAMREELERFRIFPGDVLITKDSETWNDIGVPALVVDSGADLVCGYHLALLRPFVGQIISDYLFRALQTNSIAYHFHVEANGVTRYGLSHSAIKSIRLPVPPQSEQLLIVRFLERVDRRMRRYIRAKQKLIKLLEEQKQSIIHRAVTRGLDPNVRLKPSGTKWLGDMPEHWEVRRLKSLVHRIDQGISPQAENCLAGEAWGVLKAGCVNRGIFRELEHKRLPVSMDFDHELAIAEGDVLVSRANGSPHLVGSVGRVTSLRFKLILSDKTFRLVLLTDVDPDFMVLTMNSRYYRHQVEQAISGAKGLANNLPLSSLRGFFFAIPPLQEQTAIIRHLRPNINDAMRSLSRVEREVSLMHEYRTRLIADVVTGKLDVRDVAARLPDETEDSEVLDETAAEILFDDTTETIDEALEPIEA